MLAQSATLKGTIAAAGALTGVVSIGVPSGTGSKRKQPRQWTPRR